MADEMTADLIRLYARKGELVTEIEIMEAQLQKVNQQIVRTHNEVTQKKAPEIKQKKKK